MIRSCFVILFPSSYLCPFFVQPPIPFPLSSYLGPHSRPATPTRRASRCVSSRCTLKRILPGGGRRGSQLFLISFCFRRKRNLRRVRSCYFFIFHPISCICFCTFSSWSLPCRNPYPGAQGEHSHPPSLAPLDGQRCARALVCPLSWGLMCPLSWGTPCIVEFYREGDHRHMFFCSNVLLAVSSYFAAY